MKMYNEVFFFLCLLYSSDIGSVEVVYSIKVGKALFSKFMSNQHEQTHHEDLKRSRQRKSTPAYDEFDKIFLTYNRLYEYVNIDATQEIETLAKNLNECTQYQFSLKDIFKTIAGYKDFVRRENRTDFNQFFVDTIMPILFRNYNFLISRKHEQCKEEKQVRPQWNFQRKRSIKFLWDEGLSNRMKSGMFKTGIDCPELMNYYIYLGACSLH